MKTVGIPRQAVAYTYGVEVLDEQRVVVIYNLTFVATFVVDGDFFVCTIAINTTAFWLLYASGVPYTTYLISRLFIQGQIWNSLFNYALLFVAVPTLSKVKPLGLNL